MMKRLVILLMAMLLTWGSGAHSSAVNLCVLPEDFNELGTWTIDTNASGAFRSVCLRGLSSRVDAEPAVAQLYVPEAGTYRVWVRSRDFAVQPGSRFFQIAINGVPLEKTFGQHGVDGWQWEDAGTVSLEAGTVQVAALDTSTYWARMDAIFLTTDLNRRPPTTFEQLLAESQPKSKTASSRFPEWAKKLDNPVLEAVLENDWLRVKFGSFRITV